MQAPVEDAAHCPFCGEPLPGTVRACPHCDEDLTAMAAADMADAAAKATRADAEAGDFQPVPARAFRRFRDRTLVAGGISVACILAVILLSGSRGNALDLPTHPWALAGALAVAFVGWGVWVIVFLVALEYLISDLLLAAPEKLTTPKKAVETYLKCLLEKRWEYAFHLVAPRGREGTRRRPAFEKLQVKRGTFTLQGPGDLEAYWKPLFQSSLGTVRTPRRGKVLVEEEGGVRAVACCSVTVTAYLRWIQASVLLVLTCYPLAALILYLVLYLVLRKREEMAVELPLIRVDGRWYLLDAVPSLVDDPQGLAP